MSEVLTTSEVRRAVPYLIKVLNLYQNASNTPGNPWASGQPCWSYLLDDSFANIDPDAATPYRVPGRLDYQNTRPCSPLAVRIVTQVDPVGTSWGIPTGQGVPFLIVPETHSYTQSQSATPPATPATYGTMYRMQGWLPMEWLGNAHIMEVYRQFASTRGFCQLGQLRNAGGLFLGDGDGLTQLTPLNDEFNNGYQLIVAEWQ